MASRFYSLPRAISTSINHTTAASYRAVTSRPLSRLHQIHSQIKNTKTMATAAYRANGDNGDDGSTEGELNQWKFRAPYKVHDNDPNFHVRYEGSCHCGRIKYQLSREKPLDSKFCHCTTCQKIHGEFKRSHHCGPLLTYSGAPFQWAAIFHKEDINFTHGHHDLGWYESSEKTCVHKLPCKVSCAYCRTPIMDEGRNMILLFPTLINFKNPEERKNFDIT